MQTHSTSGTDKQTRSSASVDCSAIKRKKKERGDSDDR